MPVRRHDIPNQARFLTYSCHQRHPLLGSAHIRDAYLQHLDMARKRLSFHLYAWVIMPEHVHVIVRPPDGVLAPTLRAMKQGFGQRTIREWRTDNDPRLGKTLTSNGEHRFWQRGGGYDRNIRSADELRRHVDYIHENPLRRGLVDRAEDWAWSSCAAWQGHDTMIQPDHPT